MLCVNSKSSAHGQGLGFGQNIIDGVDAGVMDDEIRFLWIGKGETRGHAGKGAQRWLDLGGQQIQPSELMKLGLILALAAWFHRASWERVGHPSFLVLPLVAILIPVGLILIVVTYAGWQYLSHWESTDDAQVDGHIHPINAKVGGTVLSVNVVENHLVEGGTILAQLDSRDYEVAVMRAQAELAQAQADVVAALRRLSMW